MSVGPPGAPRVDAVADGALLAALLGAISRGAALEAAWPPPGTAAPPNPDDLPGDAAVLLGLLALHLRFRGALDRLAPLPPAPAPVAPPPRAPGDARLLR